MVTLDPFHHGKGIILFLLEQTLTLNMDFPSLLIMLLPKLPSMDLQNVFHCHGITHNIVSFFFFLNLLLAALGLGCCARAFSSCGEQVLLCVVVHGLLIVVASLVAEHRL